MCNSGETSVNESATTINGGPTKSVTDLQKRERRTGFQEPNSSETVQHQRVIAPKPIFRCDRCGGTLFSRLTEMLRHMKVEHEDTHAKTNNPVGHSLGSPSSRCPTEDIESSLIRLLANKASKDTAAVTVISKVPIQEPRRNVRKHGPEFKRPTRVRKEDVYLSPWSSNCANGEASALPVSLRIDYDWLRTMSKRALNALPKTTSSKKDFTNMWNDFNLRNERMAYSAARNPCDTLRRFVIENRQAIIDGRLGVELVAHVELFHHYGHITREQSREVLAIFTSGQT